MTITMTYILPPSAFQILRELREGGGFLSADAIGLDHHRAAGSLWLERVGFATREFDTPPSVPTGNFLGLRITSAGKEWRN